MKIDTCSQCFEKNVKKEYSNMTKQTFVCSDCIHLYKMDTSAYRKKETEENIPVSVIDSLQLFLDEPIFVNPMKTIIKRVMMIGDKIDDSLNYKGYRSENNIDVIYLKIRNNG